MKPPTRSRRPVDADPVWRVLFFVLLPLGPLVVGLRSLELGWRYRSGADRLDRAGGLTYGDMQWIRRYEWIEDTDRWRRRSPPSPLPPERR